MGALKIAHMFYYVKCLWGVDGNWVYRDSILYITRILRRLISEGKALLENSHILGLNEAI